MSPVVCLFLQVLLGLLFGLGRVVSGLCDPARILAFLDLAAIPQDGWDPTLIPVFLASVAVTFVGYRWAFHHPRPLFGDRFHLPDRTDPDGRLVVGAALFGLGWGLAGLCPGPAVIALGTLRPEALLFAGPMLVGMVAAQGLSRWHSRSVPGPLSPLPTGASGSLPKGPLA